MNGGNQMANRAALLQHIDEVSFAAYDTLLFLDTHPKDAKALAFYQEMRQKRKEAMEEYGRLYGPLTVDCAYTVEDGCWKWIQQPWPWEGGMC